MIDDFGPISVVPFIADISITGLLTVGLSEPIDTEVCGDFKGLETSLVVYREGDLPGRQLSDEIQYIPALELIISPDEYSNLDLLGFTWKITAFESDYFQI